MGKLKIQEDAKNFLDGLQPILNAYELNKLLGDYTNLSEKQKEAASKAHLTKRSKRSGTEISDEYSQTQKVIIAVHYIASAIWHAHLLRPSWTPKLLKKIPSYINAMGGIDLNFDINDQPSLDLAQLLKDSLDTQLATDGAGSQIASSTLGKWLFKAFTSDSESQVNLAEYEAKKGESVDNFSAPLQHAIKTRDRLALRIEVYNFVNTVENMRKNCGEYIPQTLDVLTTQQLITTHSQLEGRDKELYSGGAASPVTEQLSEARQVLTGLQPTSDATASPNHPPPVGGVQVTASPISLGVSSSTYGPSEDALSEALMDEQPPREGIRAAT